MGLVDIDIHVLSHLKEELAWAVGKQLLVISTIMLFKTSKTTKELKGTSHFEFNTILHMLICGP